jgi:hypothetical protein
LFVVYAVVALIIALSLPFTPSLTTLSFSLFMDDPTLLIRSSSPQLAQLSVSPPSSRFIPMRNLSPGGPTDAPTSASSSRLLPPLQTTEAPRRAISAQNRRSSRQAPSRTPSPPRRPSDLGMSDGPLISELSQDSSMSRSRPGSPTSSRRSPLSVSQLALSSGLLRKRHTRLKIQKSGPSVSAQAELGAHTTEPVVELSEPVAPPTPPPLAFATAPFEPADPTERLEAVANAQRGLHSNLVQIADEAAAQVQKSAQRLSG